MDCRTCSSLPADVSLTKSTGIYIVLAVLITGGDISLRMSINEGGRVECRWKPLREGEMSPCKMLIALFIREVYAQAAAGNDGRKSIADRPVSPKTLMLIYNLISSYDVDTFQELKTMLEKSGNGVKPEVLRKFNRVTSNLEPYNSYFLYELANSIVSMEASQMVVLKKKITKNSPIGKFVRGIYLNVKKLSYPQADFMYKQLLEYLNVGYGEHGSSHGHHGRKDKENRVPRVLKSLDLFQKLDNKNAGQLDLKLFNSYINEYRKTCGSSSEIDQSPVCKRRLAKSDGKGMFSPMTPSSGSSIVVSFRKRDSESKQVSQDNQSDLQASVSSTPLTPLRKGEEGMSFSESFNETGTTIPTSEKLSVLESSTSAGWNSIKHWSRKQIEKAIKSLISRLYCANVGVPNPNEISRFVKLSVTNPSSAVLMPHLHYLEYLNGLRLKDVTRCSDSLRASFDVRIKPNTTELNKGTTYAAYNNAMFYSQFGYADDALSSLNEAFGAGHAVGDATCLHHCHNLWSHFHSEAYTDAIVTVTKEVDNNMAYLHSLNVIVNAFDVLSNGSPADEVLHSLWHYNADCDLEEMEGLLLSALSNFYTIFGWHNMISFTSQMILFTNWKWSSRFYGFALCSLSQCLLYNGDVESSTEIMEYGSGIFALDSSPAGQSFMLQYAIFQALKSYFAYEPVSNEVMSTLRSFDELEVIYWRGYNLMIRRNLKEAANVLSKFVIDLKSKKSNYILTDIKLRTLLLLAEVECLSRNFPVAITCLTEALEIAISTHSDIYVTLCLFSVAAIQCEDNQVKSSLLTLESKTRSAIRSASPWLMAKINVIKVKVCLRQGEEFDPEKQTEFMKMLEDAENVYKKWRNNYRIKEVLHWKAELLDRCRSKNSSPSSSPESQSQRSSEIREQIQDIASHLPWTESTCII